MPREHYTRRQVEKTVMGIARPVVTGVFVVFVVAPILGFFIQLLWNSTIAVMFELAPISFWQAVGLFILAKLFFGFGGSSGSSSGSGQGKSRHRKSADTSTGEAEPKGDDTFTAYWRDEGKAAYETFLATRNDTPQDQP